jgi:hypothetical protein
MFVGGHFGRVARTVIGNTAPRQKEEDRMEKWKILKSPRPKKPAVHGGLREGNKDLI